MLTVDGDQVPVIPFVDVVVKTGTVPPEQILSEVPKANVGVTFGLTVTLSPADSAHCPADGVKIYPPEFVLSIVVGLHDPVIPFADVVGKAGTLPPEQTVSDAPKLNVGAMLGLTVTEKIVVVAHCPADGVKV